MRPRDQKTVVTKAIRKYVREGVLLKKLCMQPSDTVYYEVIITPTSDRLLLTVKSTGNPYMDRVSIPRFSDYIVKLGDFDSFMLAFKVTLGIQNTKNKLKEE